MRVFNIFKKKPKAQASPKAEPVIPAPPHATAHEELPSFPKFEAKVDTTPDLPSLSPELVPPVNIPRPPRVNTFEQPQPDDNIPNISPYELDPKIPTHHEEKPAIQAVISEPAPVEIKPHEEPKKEVPEPAKGPIYIGIDDYKVLLSNISEIKKSTGALNQAIANIKEVKTKESSTYRSWQRELDDMKKKFSFVDKSLFEKEG